MEPSRLPGVTDSSVSEDLGVDSSDFEDFNTRKEDVEMSNERKETTINHENLEIENPDHVHHQQIINKLLEDEKLYTDTTKEELEFKEEDLPREVAKEGYCCECLEGFAVLECLACEDNFCDVCFTTIHRTGNRKKHVTQPYARINVTVCEENNEDGTEINDMYDDYAPKSVPDPLLNLISDENHIVESSDEMMERAKYIPLRLTFKERKVLRLIEASLHVSEYTDRVDVEKFTDRRKRTVQQVKEICAILTGVVTSNNYENGQVLLEDREFCRHSDFYQEIFEISRRYKILNPERMRSTYGKLIYFLQDTCSSDIKSLLEINCVRPLRTVYSCLSELKQTRILKDNVNLEKATRVIAPYGKSRAQIQKEIKSKNAAVKYLCRTYATRTLSEDDIERCLHSINDNNTFLYANRDPCDKMIEYLKENFMVDSFEDGLSLAIIAGEEGARLTHNHTRQFHYCLQSLTLWREVLHDFFKLWYFAEQDLLCESTPYQLKDTGQGLNRIQNCPRTFRLMQSILNRAQQQVEQWIGSSVVHLGDHNVPNALMFISKYTQIAQILSPVCLCLEQLEVIVKNKYIKEYIDTEFGGTKRLKKLILRDFFCHAFDGSGADNFFDAGSCIDGRLTSAWHWCSQLEKKPFYHVFLLTGFVGFDGEFA